MESEQNFASIEEVIRELARLNDNLEALRKAQPQLEGLVEVLNDLRKMAAGALGWEDKGIKGDNQD
ncbi:hypothetical protein HY387_01265 [Candidatus Daviesbacteria bacterium]|nr:hypothetical protein [Candidatus Daviesbacteria bacterium]